jgi:hypothetical protein
LSRFAYFQELPGAGRKSPRRMATIEEIHEKGSANLASKQNAEAERPTWFVEAKRRREVKGTKIGRSSKTFRYTNVYP